jgi:hypothetical protein
MRVSYLLCLLATILIAIGCGGGGASTGTGGGSGGGVGAGSLFITDSLDNHSQVWITIKKVTLLSTSGNVVVFDDPAGVTVDLKTLRDANGERYAFLSKIPAGTYTGIEVLVDKTLTLYQGGSSTGQTRVFEGNDGTNAVLSMTFDSPMTITSGTNLVLDFNLSGWNDNGTTVTGTPFLRLSRGDNLNDNGRHERFMYHGTVQNLQGDAPNQTFTLTRGRHSITVKTDENTDIFFESGSDSPALANGQKIHVRGQFSVSDRAVIADFIRIDDVRDDEEEDEVRGTTSNIDAAAGTFVVTIVSADGFLPTSSQVTIAINSNTVFLSESGMTLTREEFFADLTEAEFVEIEGTYDANTNTFTATRVRLEDEDDHNGGGDHGHHRGQLVGPVSNIDVTGFRFDVTKRAWQGINLPNGTVVHVVTTSTTEFRNTTRDQFFADLDAGNIVQARGTYDPATNTLTATSVHASNGGG